MAQNKQEIEHIVSRLEAAGVESDVDLLHLFLTSGLAIIIVYSLFITLIIIIAELFIILSSSYTK